MVNSQFFICPVCGFDRIEEEPWIDNSPSYYICPCCGTEYGFDDFADTKEARGIKHKKLREKWIKGGMSFWSQDERKPEDWDPIRQLRT